MSRQDSYYSPRSRTYSPGPQPAKSPASAYGSAYGSPRVGSVSRRPQGSFKGAAPGSARVPQGTVKGPPPGASWPPKGTVKQPVGPQPGPVIKALPSYDDGDRGPEDRFNVVCQGKSDWFNWVRHNDFDVYDPLIKGALIIEGVNYSKYEALKDEPYKLEAFHNALKEDFISEVGNSVRTEDIKLKVFPGQIKTVVLHYDTRNRTGRSRDQTPPQLVDAEWCMKVDYVIRSRDTQRQQNIAMALYTTFTSEAGFAGSKARAVYVRDVDDTADVRGIKFSRPVTEAPNTAKESAEPRLVSPTRRLGSIPTPMQQARPMQLQVYTPTEPRNESVSPGTQAGMDEGIEMMTSEQIVEKDRQLEKLQLEIVRERKALRELRQNVPLNQGKRHAVFTPQAPTSDEYNFSSKHINPVRPMTSQYDSFMQRAPGKDLLSSSTMRRSSVPSVHEF